MASVVSANPPAPFFIVGCPRSGTTLLSQLLDHHPALAVYHETQFYPVFRPHLRFYGDLERPANAARLTADVREWLLLQGVTPPDAGELAATTFAGTLAALLAAHARHQGKRHGGDKTPEHHAHLDEILADLPDSTVIFVVRDPRDTIRSFRKAFGATIPDAAHAWNRAFENALRFRDRVHLVRYEELVSDPPAELARLCEALAVSYDPAMLRFYEDLPDRLRQHGNAQRLVSPISTASVGSYRDMDPADVALIETLCQRGMRELGYELTTSPQAAPEPARRPTGPAWLVAERLRYYWGRPDRMRFGWFRIRINLRARARHALGRT